MNKEYLGAVLKSLALQKGKTVENIHDDSGLLPSQIEIAMKGGGTAVTLAKILDALDCNLTDMLSVWTKNKKTQLQIIEERLDELELKISMIPIPKNDFHSLNEHIEYER